MSTDIKYESLNILLGTLEGRQVLSTFIATWRKTSDILNAYDAAKQTAEKNFSSVPIQIFAVLDLLKIIGLLNPTLLTPIHELLLDLFPKSKQ
jgi:hypothetical protein